jgi:pimeloyl-ACP methyl ester carboxylesterase
MTETPTYQSRTVEALASFARVIAFDQRGVGMSDRMDGTPGLETRMDDVRAVMDAAGSSRAAILSASIGVPTSLLFAATYPERTSALVLVRGFARHLWAADYPWGSTLERERSVVEAYQLLYYGSPREAAERLGGGNVLYSDEDLEYLRRAAARGHLCQETRAVCSSGVSNRGVGGDCGEKRAADGDSGFASGSGGAVDARVQGHRLRST